MASVVGFDSEVTLGTLQLLLCIDEPMALLLYTIVWTPGTLRCDCLGILG
jgi:hypothetical protein